MAKPVLSFVVPHRNHGEFLPECIQSCIAARSVPFEIIVIDDASDDGSRAQVERLEGSRPEIVALYNESRMGVEATINRGLKEARGDYIVFRAADDRSLPDFLDEAIRALEEYSEVAYVLGDIRYFSELTSLGRLERMGVSQKVQKVDSQNWHEVFGGGGLTVASAVLRRSAVNKHGGMKRELRWLSDWALMVRMGFEDGMVYIPKPACRMMVRGGSYNSANSASGRPSLEVLAQLLNDLGSLSKIAVNGMVEAKLCSFFRSSLQAFDDELLAKLSSDAKSLYDSSFGQLPAARESCGLSGALRSFLEESAEELSKRKATAIYGLGGHTRTLMWHWRRMGLPEPIACLCTSVPDVSEFEGIPCRQASLCRKDEYDAIVVSSKSYDSEIAVSAQANFPEAKLFRPWV